MMNLLSNLPAYLPEELLTTLLQAPNVRIEWKATDGRTLKDIQDAATAT
jgi:hypothetical protein